MNYFVYIITNMDNSVMYVGVTNNLERRMYEHKNKLLDGFTKRYNVYKLVYFEMTTDITSAITREKQINGWKRCKKNQLVESVNRHWQELKRENSYQPTTTGDSSLRSE